MEREKYLYTETYQFRIIEADEQKPLHIAITGVDWRLQIIWIGKWNGTWAHVHQLFTLFMPFLSFLFQIY